eukprot:751335-Hanusia_phi.AAC.5
MKDGVLGNQLAYCADMTAYGRRERCETIMVTSLKDFHLGGSMSSHESSSSCSFSSIAVSSKLPRRSNPFMAPVVNCLKLYETELSSMRSPDARLQAS